MKIFKKYYLFSCTKNKCKGWTCEQGGYYANGCKIRKNNKPIDTLSSIDYFELSVEEALDLTLKNNKKIVEIVVEDEHEESDYEKTSHMMEIT